MQVESAIAPILLSGNAEIGIWKMRTQGPHFSLYAMHFYTTFNSYRLYRVSKIMHHSATVQVLCFSNTLFPTNQTRKGRVYHTETMAWI